MPADPTVALRQDLRDSIAEAVRLEARRNELVIAYVRAGLYVLLTLTELYWAFVWNGDQADSIPLSARMPVLLFMPLAVALAVALHRGWYHSVLQVVLPLADFIIVGLRLHFSFSMRTPESLAAHHDMATVMGAAAALMLSGAFRLQWTSTWLSVGLGLGFYAYFSRFVNILPGMLVVQLILLAGVGGVAVGMTVRLLKMLQSAVARQALIRFIPEHVVDSVHADPLALISRPRSVEATVLVSDIRGYTAWAENRSPLEVLAFLNRVQGAFAAEVHAQGGLVDKFLGDGMLAIFGATGPMDDHADRAMAAARGMLRALDEVNASLPEADRVRIGIGLHSGELVVGVLGAGPKLEFTALGHTVNTASRLEALSKERGGPVLLSAETARRLSDRADLVAQGSTTIRGHSDETELYSLPWPG